MPCYTIHEAKTHFSQIINRVLAGEEILVARGKHPVVQIMPLHGGNPPRQIGTAKGLIRIHDDFDETPEDFHAYI